MLFSKSTILYFSKEDKSPRHAILRRSKSDDTGIWAKKYNFINVFYFFAIDASEKYGYIAEQHSSYFRLVVVNLSNGSVAFAKRSGSSMYTGDRWHSLRSSVIPGTTILNF